MDADLPLALRNEHLQHEAYRLREMSINKERQREEEEKKRREHASKAIGRLRIPPELKKDIERMRKQTEGVERVIERIEGAQKEEGGDKQSAAAGAAAAASSRRSANEQQGGSTHSQPAHSSQSAGDPMMMILKQLEKLSERVERMEIRGNWAQERSDVAGEPQDAQRDATRDAPDPSRPHAPDPPRPQTMQGYDNTKGKGKDGASGSQPSASASPRPPFVAWAAEAERRFGGKGRGGNGKGQNENMRLAEEALHSPMPQRGGGWIWTTCFTQGEKG